MKVSRDFTAMHPLLIQCVQTIQRKVIDPYNAPFRLFETGRTSDRHHELVSKGKTTDLISMHLFDLEATPPLYCTAVDYVYFDGKWSWNLRNSTISSWYQLFGNMVLDVCPELRWKGLNRTNINYNHFSLKEEFIIENIDKYPCAV